MFRHMKRYFVSLKKDFWSQQYTYFNQSQLSRGNHQILISQILIFSHIIVWFAWFATQDPAERGRRNDIHTTYFKSSWETTRIGFSDNFLLLDQKSKESKLSSSGEKY